MEKTWKVTTAGTLNIVCGALAFIGGIVLLIAGETIASFLAATIPGLHLIIADLTIPIIVMGVIAMAGGVCALQRKIWWLAVLGAVCCLPCPVMGMASVGMVSIVFLALGKSEFK